VAGVLVFFLKIIENKNQHISAVTTTLEEKMKEKENITTFAKRISEITLLQNSIDSRFIDPDKIDSFVSYLEELDSNTGADILVKNIEISPKIKNVVSFKLMISGTFQQVMRTITFLENIPYEVNITQVYLNKNISQETTEDATKPTTIPAPTWQADVSFNILSLN
jgi:hypothetical protein